LATDKIASAFTPGNHASTFGGNPLAMAAVNATLETILQDGLLESSQKKGEYFLSQLQRLKAKHKVIREVRGKGLMLACTLNIECSDIVNECLNKGMLINGAGNKTLRFVPPLIITTEDIDQLIGVLDEVMEGK
jgi:acetylornithine/N-succinyldiaminopimelate aminotransferase